MNTTAEGQLVPTSITDIKAFYGEELKKETRENKELDGVRLRNLLELRDQDVARTVARRKREIKAALEITPFWPKFCMRVVSCGMHSAEWSGVGTWGAFVGLLIQLIAQYVFGLELQGMIILMLTVSALDLIVTRPGEVCMLKFYGPRKCHTGELVNYDFNFNQDCLDETAGYLWAWVVLMLLQHLNLIPELAWWAPVLVFLVFRLFNAVKPWPIKRVENAFGPGSAWGILLDDVVAGIMAGLYTVGPVWILTDLMK